GRCSSDRWLMLCGRRRPTNNVLGSRSIRSMPGKIDATRRIVIERVQPELDCGRYAIKREVGDTVEVTADIFKEGHDVIAAAILYRPEDEQEWQEAPM